VGLPAEQAGHDWQRTKSRGPGQAPVGMSYFGQGARDQDHGNRHRCDGPIEQVCDIPPHDALHAELRNLNKTRATTERIEICQIAARFPREAGRQFSGLSEANVVGGP
jgi:hypothetical protein